MLPHHRFMALKEKDVTEDMSLEPLQTIQI